MDEQLKKLAQKFTATWKAFSRKKQFLIVGTVAAVLIALISIVAVLNTTKYELLYSGLSTSQAGQIYNAVSAQNVPVKVEGTDIYVQQGRANTLRMQLAESNMPQGNLPYDLYASGNNFAETDKDKQIKQLQQTQNRLQSAIETIPYVSNAIVTVAQSDSDTYVLESDQTATTASVKLTLDNGQTLTKSQVDGIVRLVAGSVPGLSTENVTVTDTYGNVLNDDSGVNGSGDASEQLEVKSQYEQAQRKKILQLLGNTYGSSNVNVVVNADLDFSSVSTVTNSYTSGVINYQAISSSVTSNTSGAATGATGTSGAQPTYSNTSTTTGGQFTSNYNKTESALVGNVTQATTQNGPKLKKLSIAVLLNTQSTLAAGANAAALKQTIADATGAAVADISIQQLTFSSASIPSSSSAVSGPGILIPGPSNFIYFIVAAALLLIILLSLLLVLLNMRKKKRETERAALEAAQAEALAAAAGSGKPERRPLEPLKSIEEQLAETEGNSMKKQIEDFTDKKPELVAQILKNWLKD